MTEKDFIAMANLIKEHAIIKEGGKQSHIVNFPSFICDLCILFKRSNSVFNRERFIEYIEDSEKYLKSYY